LDSLKIFAKTDFPFVRADSQLGNYLSEKYHQQREFGLKYRQPAFEGDLQYNAKIAKKETLRDQRLEAAVKLSKLNAEYSGESFVQLKNVLKRQNDRATLDNNLYLGVGYKSKGAVNPSSLFRSKTKLGFQHSLFQNNENDAYLLQATLQRSFQFQARDQKFNLNLLHSSFAQN
jgi:hypothetical protein